MEDILNEPLRLTLQQQLLESQAEHPSWSAVQHIAFLGKSTDVENISIVLGTSPVPMITQWMAENKNAAEIIRAERIRAGKLRRELEALRQPGSD